MLKKTLIGVLVLLVVCFAGAYIWARTVLTGEHVRTALAAQVGQAIGQPVTIGSLSATVFPRVTVTLGNVQVAGADKINVGELHVGTDLRALLSRRIEHASLKLTGARVALPLPAFTLATGSTPTAPATKPPVEIGSVDEIVLSDVQILSGGRTLKGDIELVPKGQGLVIRKIALTADRTSLLASGELTDLAGPVGAITVKAGALDLDQLLAFVNDFSTGAGLAGSNPSGGGAPSASGPSASPAPPADMNLSLSLDAESATMGGLTLSAFNGAARITGKDLTLDPVSFGLFGGQYKGSLTLTPGTPLRFKGRSTLSNVDVAAAAKFAGSPDTITGRLSGRLDFTGSGADPAAVARSVAGTARVDIADGVVKHLGLVNAIVVATSMRAGSLTQAASSATSGSNDEPFSQLGATLEIANGTLTTNDLTFEAKDVRLQAQGAVRMLASTLDLKGRVQLSDALSQQAGRDLVKYTQDQGRVTLPLSVGGTFASPSVKIDVGDMAKRALRAAADEQKERAKAEATKAIGKKLGGLFQR